MTPSTDLNTLQEGEAVSPVDFRIDYASTREVQKVELELPPSADLGQRIAKATERLLLEQSVVYQMYYALASGKHVVLYGPPGTGKTTLAYEVTRHVFGIEPIRRTASADWTSFDTIGGIRVRSEEGLEVFEPCDGCITEAILDCCNRIREKEAKSEGPQAAWLILDELNRAKLDYILGDMFTAMDMGFEASIKLDHYRGSNRPQNTVLYVPRRFRIIGTMNTYDKNYLFRLSYALIRRFAFVYIPVPTSWEDELGKVCERALGGAKERLGEAQLAGIDANSMRTEWKAAFDLLCLFVAQVRGEGAGQLNRKIGTAQLIDVVVYLTTALTLGGNGQPENQVRALDDALRTYIIPQLEGLRKESLEKFAEWLKSQTPGLAQTCEGVRDLTRFGF